jgi:hypothetical protein
LQDKELCPIRRETDDTDLHEEGGTSRRHGNPHRAKEAAGWAQAGPALSFALATIRAIYSPEVESHASSNSSSAAEEQRREGHHHGEERVELVD